MITGTNTQLSDLLANPSSIANLLEHSQGQEDVSFLSNWTIIWQELINQVLNGQAKLK